MKTFRGMYIDYNRPYHLCTNEKEFIKLLKSKGINNTGDYDFVPDGAVGMTLSFDHVNFLCVNVDIDCPYSDADITKFIAHESMHIWQHIREGLQATEIHECMFEFEAYCFEDIFNNLLNSYMNLRKQYKRNKRQKNAT